MKKLKTVSYSALAAAIFIGGLSVPVQTVQAQTDSSATASDSDEGNVIVVTARRREESSLKVET
ncbi:MAG: hypothetical protein AAGM33_09555, partial [Pseudomonadota bacterium]